MKKIVDTFIKLVQIDSPSGEEQDMAEYLTNWLTKVGYGVKVDKVGNILAFLNSSEPKLLLCAHMDTVMPGKGIKPVIKNGVIKSDGNTILGADNKASISAIICAVENFLSIHGSPPNIEILFSVKEETGGGLEYFPFKWVKSEYGVVFDHAKPLGIITTAAPYIYNFKIRFKGKPAHSSKPEKGVNALNVAVKYLKTQPIGAFDDHKTTINIGKISGGVGINVVPEDVVIEGEVRSTVKKRFDYHLKQVKSLASKTAVGTGAKIYYSQDGYCAGYSYKKNDPFMKRIERILRELNLKVGYDVSTGVSDVNTLIEGGVKAICLSDGIKDPHTKKENVSINNLDNLCNLVYRTIERFVS